MNAKNKTGIHDYTQIKIWDTSKLSQTQLKSLLGKMMERSETAPAHQSWSGDAYNCFWGWPGGVYQELEKC